MSETPDVISTHSKDLQRANMVRMKRLNVVREKIAEVEQQANMEIAPLETERDLLSAKIEKIETWMRETTQPLHLEADDLSNTIDMNQRSLSLLEELRHGVSAPAPVLVFQEVLPDTLEPPAPPTLTKEPVHIRVAKLREELSRHEPRVLDQILAALVMHYPKPFGVLDMPKLVQPGFLHNNSTYYNIFNKLRDYGVVAELKIRNGEEVRKLRRYRLEAGNDTVIGYIRTYYPETLHGEFEKKRQNSDIPF